ncbi:MAG: pyrroline-5-carboxylate reductase dimerization domain-containing protein [Parvularculaceae bacterium]
MNERICVGLIGAGAMGGALMRGWLANGVIDPARSAIFDPRVGDSMRALATDAGVAVNPAKKDLRVDALVIAVKPQIAADVLPAYAPLAKDALSISVMAGKSIASVARALGAAALVARAMPNLPAAIGEGVTGLFAPEGIDARGRAVIERLMAAVGETVWVESERGIDLVTAVSGSGPAYFFAMVEALADAGVHAGLDAAAAAKLARATMTSRGAGGA